MGTANDRLVLGTAYIPDDAGWPPWWNPVLGEDALLEVRDS